MRRLEIWIATALLTLESEVGFAGFALVSGLGFITCMLALLAR